MHVSDTAQGPGWWQASDGRWYSPEQTPGPLPPVPDYPPPIAPGQTVPTTTIPTGGPGVPPAVPDAGVQNGFDASGAPTGSAWYPPPGDPGYGPPPVTPGYGPAPATPGYGPPPNPGYGSGYGPPPATPGYGYQPGYPPYGYVPAGTTNGLAVASLICSLLWVFGVGSVLAVVFGFVARSQINRSDDGQRGGGLALAGIIVGFVGIVGMILIITAAIVVDHQCHQPGNCTLTTLNTQN